MFQNFFQSLSRCLAAILFLLRKKDIQAAHLKFLVFTGTSGKTTTRYILAHALRKLGHKVVSPPYGYTNELGIVLAALGFESFSWKNSWRKIFSNMPISEAFICIELGADFRKDVSWFLRRFQPVAVFFAGVDGESWTSAKVDIFADRKKLADSLPSEGVALYMTDNVPEISIRDLSPKNVLAVVPPVMDDLRIQPESQVLSLGSISLNLGRHIFDPQRRGFALALKYLEHIGELGKIGPDFFSEYDFPPDRLEISLSESGFMVISDIYKAVPHDTRWFLKMAQGIPANRKVLVISEMRPQPRNAPKSYGELGSLMNFFDAVYFVGDKKIGDSMRFSGLKTGPVSPERYADIAGEIKGRYGAGDIVFLKGAFKFKLNGIKDLLL